MKKTSENGFIAIISTLLIFFILMLLVLAISFAAYTGRMNTLEAEFQADSRALASSCAESALGRMAKNRDYAGGDTLAIGSGVCSIVSVTSSPDQLLRTITVKSDVGRSVTRLRVDLEIKHLRIRSWREILD
ncbi:hypothetical protein HY627_00355 [Candidatus Uhrbacteria bacterium]|nr:hypothetical protein [Candidatus Uhrbacteria bacterium]